MTALGRSGDELNGPAPAGLAAVLLVALFFCTAALPLAAQPGGSALGRLSGDNSRPQPLPLAEAFPFYVSETAAGEYQITWNPAAGHYLYRHAFGFSLQQPGSNNDRPLEFSLPPGLPRSDQFFGDIEAYYDTVSVTLELPEVRSNSSLIIEFQGCADWGFCYPPQRQTYPLGP